MAEMRADGYTVARAAVAQSHLTTVRARVDEAVARGGDGVDVRAGTVWIRDALTLGDEVTCLAACPVVVEAVAELLGPAPQLLAAVMRNPVGETAQQALHVDWAGPIHPGQDQQVQAIFYLDDVGHDNGPTRLVPGTHAGGGAVPRRFADPATRHPREVLVLAAAGDALVFSSHLWHSGTANRSSRPRRVLTFTYRRAQ